MSVRTKRSAFRSEQAWGWLFISPWVLGFSVFTAVPLFFSLYLSFHRWDMFSDPVRVGWENFRQLLDPSSGVGDTFYAALFNTVLYTALTAVINIVVGLAVAWAVARASKFNTVLRTLIYLPCMVIGIAFSMMMGPIFGSSDFALINQIRNAFGQPSQEWLFTRGQGVWVMVLMSFWGIGGAMIIFVAGIKNIDACVYDAAAIDGAGHLKTFIRICIPMLFPVLVYQTIMSLIFGMQVFDIAVGLSSIGGASGSFGMGLNNSLATLVFYLYNKGFKDFQMGMASAIGWLIFLLTSVLAAGLYGFVKKTGYYSAD